MGWWCNIPTSNTKLVSSNFLTNLQTNDSIWSIIWGAEGWRVRSCGSWLQNSHTKLYYILTEDYADSTHPFSKTSSVKTPHMLLCGALFHITNKAELLTEPEGLNFPTNHAKIRRRPWIFCNDLGLSPPHPTLSQLYKIFNLNPWIFNRFISYRKMV